MQRPSLQRVRRNGVGIGVFVIFLCSLAFVPAVKSRLTPCGDTQPCKHFCWQNVGSNTLACDYWPLEGHAQTSLGWLGVFCIQLATALFLMRRAHRLVGYVGMVIWFCMVTCMLYFTWIEAYMPMTDSLRPDKFRLSMFLLSVEIGVDGYKAFSVLYYKEPFWQQEHVLWMLRAMCASTGPISMRLYTLEIREYFGFPHACVTKYTSLGTMESSAVGSLVVVVLMLLINWSMLGRTFDDDNYLVVRIGLTARQWHAYYGFRRELGLGTLISSQLQCAQEIMHIIDPIPPSYIDGLLEHLGKARQLLTDVTVAVLGTLLPLGPQEIQHDEF